MSPEQVYFYSNDTHMFVLDTLERLLRTFGSRDWGLQKDRSPSGHWIIILDTLLNESYLCEFHKIVKKYTELSQVHFFEVSWDDIPNSISYVNGPFKANFPGFQLSSRKYNSFGHACVLLFSSFMYKLCWSLFFIFPIVFIKIPIMYLGKWVCLFLFPQANPVCS